MTQIKGVANIFQMLLLSKSKVVAIEGPKHRLISFDSSEVRGRCCFKVVEAFITAVSFGFIQVVSLILRKLLSLY